MKRIRMLIVVLLGITAVSTSTSFVPDCSRLLAAEPRSEGSLRSKKEAQLRARSMARELISSILDIQLKQLKENGLDKLPIYGEISAMRQNIDKLVEAEMLEVVDLLVKAQTGPQSQRQARLGEAREKIREIVIGLSVERQNLLRRLKIAELSAQVRRLIELETSVANVTEALPEQPKTRQETQALSAVQDQRDVKALFFRLVDTLQDVSNWGGAVGAGAANGLRILKAAQVGEELDKAGNRLEQAQFADAATSQRAVIKGLQALLEKIEETQGLISTDTEDALKKVQELIAKQEELREKTKQPPANEKAAEKLVEEQAQLRKDLNQLNDALEKMPAAAPLLEQAKAAAYEATANLFDEKPADAFKEQSKVLGNLAEIAEQLHNAADPAHAGMSADQLARAASAVEGCRQTTGSGPGRAAKGRRGCQSRSVGRGGTGKARGRHHGGGRKKSRSFADRREYPAGTGDGSRPASRRHAGRCYEAEHAGGSGRGSGCTSRRRPGCRRSKSRHGRHRAPAIGRADRRAGPRGRGIGTGGRGRTGHRRRGGCRGQSRWPEAGGRKGTDSRSATGCRSGRQGGRGGKKDRSRGSRQIGPGGKADCRRRAANWQLRSRPRPRQPRPPSRPTPPRIS